LASRIRASIASPSPSAGLDETMDTTASDGEPRNPNSPGYRSLRTGQRRHR
jgi:hypothetical protein